MRILIYQTNLNQIGGIETFLLNFVKALWEYYDITVVYDTGDYKQVQRIAKYVDIERYDRNKEYETDIFLRTSTWVAPSNNIKARRYVDMRHNDFGYFKKMGTLSMNYKAMPWESEVVACGEAVAKANQIAMEEKEIAIENLLDVRQKPNKVLRLISFCRLDEVKGLYNMVTFADMLRKAGVKFEWNIFSNSHEDVLKGEEIHYYNPRFDLVDYICDADYSVLLSKHEGLPYQILESLQNQVPCIVTDIIGNTEKVKDGVNGYVVPIDDNGNIKEDFDVTKLYKIPKFEEYKNDSAEKWKKFFGGAKYKKKKLKETKQVPKQRLEVLKTCEYENYGEIIEHIPKDHKLTGWIIKGDEIVVSEEESERLIKQCICKKI